MADPSAPILEASTNRSEPGSFNFDAEITQTRFYVGLVCISVYLLIFIPSAIVFWVRRDQFPLSKRFPYQTIVTQVMMTIWIVTNSSRLFILPEFPCMAVLWGELGSVCVTLLLLNIRLLGLAYRYYLNMAQVDEFWRPNWKALKNDFRNRNIGSMTRSSLSVENESGDQESISSSTASQPIVTGGRSHIISADRTTSDRDSKSTDVPPYIIGCIPIQTAKNFVTKISKFQRTEYIVLFFIVSIISVLAPHIFLFATQPENHKNTYVACSRDADLAIFLVYSDAIVLYSVLIILGLFILPKVGDSIDYRTEMVLMLILATLCMVTYAVIPFVPFLGDYDHWVFPLYQVVLTPCAILINVVQIILPTALTYHNGSSMLELFGFKRKENPTKSAIVGGIDALNPVDAAHEKKALESVTLKEALASPKLIKAFQKFLQSEFAQESLYFLVEAEEFRYLVWKLGKNGPKTATNRPDGSNLDFSFRFPTLAVTKLDPLGSPMDVDESMNNVNARSSVYLMNPSSTIHLNPPSVPSFDSKDLLYDSGVLSKAFQIVRRYLLPSSPLELNLPVNIISAEVHHLMQLYNRYQSSATEQARIEGLGIGADVFDDIQRHVFEVLRLGSWPRFRKSSYFPSSK